MYHEHQISINKTFSLEPRCLWQKIPSMHETPKDFPHALGLVRLLRGSEYTPCTPAVAVHHSSGIITSTKFSPEKASVPVKRSVIVFSFVSGLFSFIQFAHFAMHANSCYAEKVSPPPSLTLGFSAWNESALITASSIFAWNWKHGALHNYWDAWWLLVKTVRGGKNIPFFGEMASSPLENKTRTFSWNQCILSQTNPSPRNNFFQQQQQQINLYYCHLWIYPFAQPNNSSEFSPVAFFQVGEHTGEHRRPFLEQNLSRSSILLDSLTGVSAEDWDGSGRSVILCTDKHITLIWTDALHHCPAGRSNDDLVLVSWQRAIQTLMSNVLVFQVFCKLQACVCG